MKVIISFISLIGVSSATFGNLLGGGALNSLLGGGGGGKSSLGSGKSLGIGSNGIEENFVSIIDQLGPGKVIERGILRRRAPKINNMGGGDYNSGGGGKIIKVIDEGPGTIVNVYGDHSGGFGGAHGGYGGGSNGGVTIIKVIHEHAGGSTGAGYAGGYGDHSSIGSSEPVKVFKIIENTSYGGDSSGISYNGGGSSGWAPISSYSGWHSG